MAGSKITKAVLTWVLLAFVLFNAGCATSHRYVLVSVVDYKTRTPVEGAIVSIHFHPRTRSVTGKDGMALLKLHSQEAENPIFDVKIVNQQYDQNFGYSESDNEWMKRPEEAIPTTPDIVLEVESRREQRHEEEMKEQQFNSAKEAAEKLLRGSPDFWPERTNQVIEILYSERWDRASKIPLGSKDDIDSIWSVIIRDLLPSAAKKSAATVEEIRWVSAKVVMVRAEGHTGSLSGGCFTYVLRKADSGWIIVTRAVDAIS